VHCYTKQTGTKTLQHNATHCSTLRHTATHCNTLQYIAAHYGTLQHCVYSYEGHATFVCGTRLNYTWDMLRSSHCNTLQRTATHCNTLQHTATHCKIACTQTWDTSRLFEGHASFICGKCRLQKWDMSHSYVGQVTHANANHTHHDTKHTPHIQHIHMRGKTPTQLPRVRPTQLRNTHNMIEKTHHTMENTFVCGTKHPHNCRTCDRNTAKHTQQTTKRTPHNRKHIHI